MSTLMKPVRNANKFQEMLDANGYAKSLLQVAYSNCTNTAKEAVTFDEFVITALRVKKLLQNYSDMPYLDYSLKAIASNLELWSNNKAAKIKAMKNNPLYDESEPFKLMRAENGTREINDDAIDKIIVRMSCLEKNRGFNTLFEQVVEPIVSIWQREGHALTENAVYEIKCLLEDFATIYKGTNLNRLWCKYGDGIYRYWYDRDINTISMQLEMPIIELIHKLNELAKIEPHVGQKFSKYILKLLKVILADKLNNDECIKKEFEKSYAELADACNPTEFTRDVVLSVDPVDYLTMSHGNSWSSCYAINSDWGTNTYRGAYSVGTWSYMNDASTMIMYQPSRERDENGLAFTTKVYRQCVMFNDIDLLITSRLYPAKHVETTALKEFRRYAQNFISEMYGITNYWVAKNRSDEDASAVLEEFVVKNDEFRGYYDLEHFSEIVYASIPKALYSNFEEYNKANKYRDEHYIYVGEECYEPVNGDTFEGYDEDECRYVNLKANDKVCRECGCVIDTDYDYYSVTEDDDYYCRDCSHWCDHHEEYESPTFEQVEIDGNYICVNALIDLEREGEAYRCGECGEYHYSQGRYANPQFINGNLMCIDCHENMLMEMETPEDTEDTEE